MGNVESSNVSLEEMAEKEEQQPVQEPRFTVAEFKKYIESQDSLGDVMYFLSAENIQKANQPAEKEEES